MKTEFELLCAIQDAEIALERAQKAANDFYELPENNQYSTIEEALESLEDILRGQAFNDCEGAGNCGKSYYERKFMVDDVIYLATLTVEYNRHDKTYYFIESSVIDYKKL